VHLEAPQHLRLRFRPRPEREVPGARTDSVETPEAGGQSDPSGPVVSTGSLDRSAAKFGSRFRCGAGAAGAGLQKVAGSKSGKPGEWFRLRFVIPQCDGEGQGESDVKEESKEETQPSAAQGRDACRAAGLLGKEAESEESAPPEKGQEEYAPANPHASHCAHQDPLSDAAAPETESSPEKSATPESAFAAHSGDGNSEATPGDWAIPVSGNRA